MPAPINLKGHRNGRLLVLRLLPERSSNGGRRWECLCDCGRIVPVVADRLNRTDEHSTRSCGCLQKDVAREHCSGPALSSHRKESLARACALPSCGREFSHPAWSKRRFCSAECRAAARNLARPARACGICGDPMPLNRKGEQWGPHRYCSDSCRRVARTRLGAKRHGRGLADQMLAIEARLGSENSEPPDAEE